MKMNTNVVTPEQSYFERTMPITGDPLVLAGLLAESGLADTYLVYEDNVKWFIDIGVAALLTADAGGTHLRINGHCQSWRSRGGAAISDALETLPIQGWRAYGIANFEMARHNYERTWLTREMRYGSKNQD